MNGIGFGHNRKIRLVQIGFGHIGMRRTLITHVHGSIDIVGVVDIKPGRLSIARDVLGDRCAYGTDYLEMMQALRPEAVIISTPNYLHASMTYDALSLGINVLCEKPLTVSSAAADRCVKLAQKKGVVLKVGSNHRFWRGVQKLLTLTAEGAVGDIQRIDGEIGYLLPDVRSDWYREKDHSGGGTLIDNCPHLFDVIGQVLQLSDGDRIQKVRCTTTRDKFGFEVEDRADGILVTERGRSVSLMSTWSEGDYRMNLDIQGSNGRIALTGFNQLEVESGDNHSIYTFDDVPPGESWGRDIQSFVDAILLKIPPTGTGEDGLDSVRIIEALYQSDKSGSTDVVI